MRARNTKCNIMVAIMAIILTLLSSCGGKIPSEFAGEWEGYMAPHRRVVLKIQKNGNYTLTIYQNLERFDIESTGVAVVSNDDLIKLPSDSYRRRFNSNRWDSDPAWEFVDAYNILYLRSDGAISDSEDNLRNTKWHLHKTSK